MAQFTITASNITTNSATIELTSEIAHTAASSVDVTVVSSNGVEAYAGTTAIPVGSIGDVISVPVTGLRSNMEYTVTAKTGTTYTDTGTFTTTDNPTARTATHSQWEDLADKVEAASVAQSTFTDLTSADYNANSSNWSDTDPANFNCIALWKLTPGVYMANNVTCNLSRLAGWNNMVSNIILVGEKDGGGQFMPITLIQGTSSFSTVNIMVALVNDMGNTALSRTFLKDADCVTNLTTNNAYVPLAASQGKVLKDLIDYQILRGATAPTTSTVGAVGTLYSYVDSGTNTPHLYSCTDTTGGTYTWVQLI